MTIRMTKAMTSVNLYDTIHTGSIDVTIENIGTIRLNSCGYSLNKLACQAAQVKLGSVGVRTLFGDCHWLLVSYDKEAGVLIVKNGPA